MVIDRNVYLLTCKVLYTSNFGDPECEYTKSNKLVTLKEESENYIKKVLSKVVAKEEIPKTREKPRRSFHKRMDGKYVYTVTWDIEYEDHEDYGYEAILSPIGETKIEVL